MTFIVELRRRDQQTTRMHNLDQTGTAPQALWQWLDMCFQFIISVMGALNLTKLWEYDAITY
jgi:hypothetical protein